MNYSYRGLCAVSNAIVKDGKLYDMYALLQYVTSNWDLCADSNAHVNDWKLFDNIA